MRAREGEEEEGEGLSCGGAIRRGGVADTWGGLVRERGRQGGTGGIEGGCMMG